MFETIPFLFFFFLFFFEFFVYTNAKVDAKFDDFEILFGEDHANIYGNSGFLKLSLDQTSGAGVRSNYKYLFGKIDVQIKLVPGNSAGTVTAFYFRGDGDNYDEVDFEFLGNVSGKPYTLHTNIFINGKGNREQEFNFWFDPRQNFHTYSILWNPHQILLSVDKTPIRVFKHKRGKGVPYPNTQPMQLYATIWNATWATRGGQVPIDWGHAPFIASYRGYRADVCVLSESAQKSTCQSSKPGWWNQKLDAQGEKQIKWVQKHHMTYNYCTDTKRFPRGIPRECFL